MFGMTNTIATKRYDIGYRQQGPDCQTYLATTYLKIA
jgi:hypothetical protein